MWKSNPNPYSDTEPEQWAQYSKAECDILEKAYQQQQKQVEFDSYIVDMENKLQIKKSDKTRQRPIKRIEVDSDVNLVEKPVWMWKSNPNPYLMAEPEQWTNYSEVECEVLEEAYQQKQKLVELDDYIVDIENGFHAKKSDASKQRPIRRILVDPTARHLREERFSISQKPIKSDSDQQHFCFIIAEWLLKNKKDKDDHPKWVEQAAKGICQEGLKTFLYKLINKALREEDKSKVDTLGAFCYYISLMNYTQEFGPSFHSSTVYSGMTLSREEISDYKASIGRYRAWLAFNSTSKIRREVEMFGNTLFVINFLAMSRHGSGIDITHLSEYPYEEEVLLQTGTNFRVDKVEEDGLKYRIYVTVV
ncbi:unnamed protein product [Didymodactylos carnosus]|uniref:WWE domain-containing protein n=1 Tax=Didymodactylos carnosus TaxID=1234261 RepID=A0A814HV89_9BILA|nr:unnamed protein product [Didymodactylos carnosus]CAF3786091.1 unnamed protein product [Didymodactylos carnosus]